MKLSSEVFCGAEGQLEVYCTQTQTHGCFSLFHRIPLCALINQHFSALARKFPDVKFIKAISTTCIPTVSDRNLPTIFVYLEGDIKAQFIGPLVFGGMNLTWMVRTFEVHMRDGQGVCLLLRVPVS